MVETPTIGAKVLATDEGYACLSDEGAVSLFTDWTANPIFHISVAGDDTQTVFEVIINGSRTQMGSELFDSVNAIRKWCHARNLSWNGTQNQLEGLRYLLSHTDVPWREGVTAVGLQSERTDHELKGSFILPNGDVIGEKDRFIYVEPPSKIEWECRLDPGQWDPYALILVSHLRSPSIMTPILGWMAAAPLRSLFKRFPVLAVFGASGWGKSTTVAEAMRVFGYHDGTPPSLGGATPHTLRATMAASNGIPVWFDEYRANTCRADTMEAFEQVIRKAWDGGTVTTGGGVSSWAELISWPCSAPLVISGETAFTEVSHRERSIVVNISGEPEDHEVEIFYRLQEQEFGETVYSVIGFGRSYLEWILHHDTLLDGSYREFGLNDLVLPNKSSRQEHGRAVARWGYTLLNMFLGDWCEQHYGNRLEFDLPPYDDTWVVEDAQDSAKTNPYIEALKEGYKGYNSKGDRFVSDDDYYTYVSLPQLMAWLTNRTDIKLPGNRTAFADYLKAEFGATYGDWNREVRECWRFPKSWKTK